MSEGHGYREDQRITVAEFLETELYFEVARRLGIGVSQLKFCKTVYPKAFAAAVGHALGHEVSPECRVHVLDKVKRPGN